MCEPGQRRGALTAATVFIVNPAAGGGRARREWPRLAADALASCAPASILESTAPTQAVALAREAASAGARLIVAVGGDGTVNEVVNGLMAAGTGARDRPSLGVVSLGTGRDLARTLDLPHEASEQVAVLARGRERAVDIGRVRYAEPPAFADRFFINIASFGLSGVTDRLMGAGARRWLPARLAFQLAVARALGVYHNAPVRLRVDDQAPIEARIKVVAVCNGRFFGGGMRIAPDAALDDGGLDLVVVGDLSVWRLARQFGTVYRGAHLGLPAVTFVRGRTIVAEPVTGAGPEARSPKPGAECPQPEASAVLLDIDGEGVGRLPATFDLVPRALHVRV